MKSLGPASRIPTSLTRPSSCPPAKSSIQEADVALDGIYIRDLDGGIGRMRRLSFDGKIEAIPVGKGQSVGELSVIAH